MMTVWRLAIREIQHRKLSFVMGVISVTIAVGCLVGAQTLLRADQYLTRTMLLEKQAKIESAVAEKEEAVQKAGAELEDAMRKHMKGLGFNVLILPKEQSRSDMLLNGMTATMPESYVEKLASSKIVTVNHLLPSVSQRIQWPERDREIILIGTRGEVPILHRGLKKPLLEEVAEGKIVLGYEIHQELGLKVGDKITLKENEFVVSALHPERGSTDDVTVWVNLAQAQEMLGMQNLINAILALECDCAGDRISAIREEIAGILPGTQVVEKYSQALARAEARAKAKESAETALKQEQESGAAILEREKNSRNQIEQQHAGFAAVMVPLVLVGSVVLIFLLMLMNARQRTEEVGILRAIGFRSKQILLVFLSKAMLIGLIGGAVGLGLGLWFGGELGGVSMSSPAWREIFENNSLITIVISAPILAIFLTGLASWIPALMAARQDPATVLQSG
ncbi:ABC transporter permease [Thalassoglobus polymorphus]|uniref:Macrolide export ATP-binding/permease protein MacB n=1 Tax=Thalassoglobus polymorphus TaxID=2527994 RepID=A0A517QN50_9PLAN|nr:FtsX-like permease family protein [Thalassoglobus polymorphus]QDT33068.1 Macrolide export ATP-binding/permease protein MacB [Thalassoglobus polymorphus]